jgi:asparagine synthase (glutamine-hydrolysing)
MIAAMDGFCGWVGWDGTDEARRQVLGRMVSRIAPWDTAAGVTAFGHKAAIGVSAPDFAPRIFAEQGYWVVIQGEARLAGQAGAGPLEAEGVARRILEDYRAHGERALARLRGGFALAIVSRDGGEALLAIDRIGGRFPLSYKVASGTLVFGTEGASIQAHPVGRSPVDPQGLFNFFYHHVLPSPRSIRAGVRQIRPAGYVSYKDGEVREGTHWQPFYRDDRRVDLPELCEEFRRLIHGGVERHARGAAMGCFLSGGTDSSTIAGYLGQVTGAPARTYSIGFDAAGFDEMEYARAAVERFRTDHHEYYVTPQDVLETIPRVARAYSEPFGNASAVPAFHCASLARRDGVERMLGGDGGDELFAGNQRYATQRVFAFYESIPTIGRRLLERTVARSSTDLLPVRKLRSYIAQARVPMPQRLHTYNTVERDGADAIFDPDFLRLVDVEEPMKGQVETYRSAQAETMLNRMLALDLKITLADNDLPKVSRMCRMAGVDVAYPFLTDEVIDFSLEVPARLKLKGLKLRWFMKHALRDFLPEKILRKKKHGFGLPFGLWMKSDARLKDFARANLERIRARNVFRGDYIDGLVRRHESEHAMYHGGTIWVLILLEQWFQHHEAPPERGV